MNEDRDLLIRFLEGDLSREEAGAVQARLERDAALRARLDRLRAMRETFTAARPASFAPYFSERVLRRLNPAARQAAGEPLYESLRWLFARTAVAALLIAGMLGAYNAFDYQDLGVTSSFSEAAFGLPATSFEDALSYGSF